MFFRSLVIPVLLLLAGCGPIIGAAMVAGGGVKEFTVVSGQLQDLKPGRRVLVISPFDKTEQAFYLCRGEEAANFTTAFNTAGLFQADFHMADRFGEDPGWLEKLKQKTPAQIQADFGLAEAPDLLMTGVILYRSTLVAPAQGIVMDVGYRLEFFDLHRQKKVQVEVRVKDLFQKCIGAVVDELMVRITGH